MQNTPLVSIIIPNYNSQQYIKETLNSVTAQIYSNWEVCICDDASSNEETLEFLRQFVTSTKNVKIKFSQINQNISKTTNLAVEFADGEFLAFVDHDDEITSDALYEVVKKINQDPNIDAIYSDQDKINEFGEKSEPFYKPDLSEKICHPGLVFIKFAFE